MNGGEVPTEAQALGTQIAAILDYRDSSNDQGARTVACNGFFSVQLSYYKEKNGKLRSIHSQLKSQSENQNASMTSLKQYLTCVDPGLLLLKVKHII